MKIKALYILSVGSSCYFLSQGMMQFVARASLLVWRMRKLQRLIAKELCQEGGEVKSMRKHRLYGL